MAQFTDPYRRALSQILTRGRPDIALLVAGGLALAAAVMLPDATGRAVLLAVTVGVGVAALAHGVRTSDRRLWRWLQTRTFLTTLKNDRSPALLTDDEGQIIALNAAARSSLGLDQSGKLADGLGSLFAAPSASVSDLLQEVANRGQARMERVGHRQHTRITATRSGPRLITWRLEDLGVDPAAVRPYEGTLPMLVIDAEGAVVAANSALDALAGEPAQADLARAIAAEGGETTAVLQLDTVDGPQRMRIHITETGTGLREVFLAPAEQGEIASAAELFDTLPVPMMKVSPDGLVLAANTSACEVLGRDVASGERVAALLTGLGRPVVDWLQDAVSGQSAPRSEFLQVCGAEGDRFLQVSLKPVDDRGTPTLLAVLTDATELKTLEAQFVQSQKMQAIGQLAGGVAHDFNNLLTAISGHCDLLLLRHDEGDPDYGDLMQIHQNANRAAGLVGQLLAFSRKQTLSPERVDLRDVLSELTHLLSRLVGETVQLKLRHDDALPPIRVDRRQLEQVIMNLVVNARDALPDGGAIRLETEAVTLATELRRNRATIPVGDYAMIRVIDHGIGIAPENLPKIFEPFFTTKKTREGTGLGLSTVYGIVKQTGGFIFADSNVGEGTTFTLYFPAFHGEEPAAEARPAP